MNLRGWLKRERIAIAPSLLEGATERNALNGDLPPMHGYYDPPDQPEPKEAEVELSLMQIVECGEVDELIALFKSELDAEEITAYDLTGFNNSGIEDTDLTFMVRYYPIDHGPDPDAAHDAMRDEG